MKSLCCLIVLTFFIISFPTKIFTQGNIGINNDGSSPHSSAMLDVKSSNKGLLIPRITTSERDEINSPASGLMIFNTVENAFNFFDGTSWIKITSKVDELWTLSGNHIYNTNSGNVGIGISAPSALLHTSGSGTGEGNVLFEGALKYSPPGDVPASGAGTRMMWYPDKAAFRAGDVDGLQWDKDSIGRWSVAMGYGTKAKGEYSFATGEYSNASGGASTALGFLTIASGQGSTALGNQANALGGSSTAMGYYAKALNEYSTSIGAFATASGFCSTAMGESITAPSAWETVIGRYNEEYAGFSPANWMPADRLFVVGNGTGSEARSNALTILKNGNTGIGTIPNTNALLHTNGTGTSGGNILFSGQYKTPAGLPPATGSGTRMMWYPDKAAFRAGHVSGTHWDKDNMGDYSVAMGNNSQASGAYSTALGYNTTASGGYATAMGIATSATGRYAVSMGESTTAPSANETVIGRWNSDYTPLDVLFWNPADRLFVVGNGTASNVRSNAMTILKNGNTGIGTETPNEKLEVNGNIHLSGADRTIFNRSNNYLALGTNNTERIRITNTGNVGIGTISPNEKLEVAGNIHLSGADRTIFNRSNNYLALGTNNTERMRITSTGNVGIGTTPNTNALLHTRGIGISGGNVLFVGSYAAIPGEPPTTGAGTRMMWYPDKAAFRAGDIEGFQWDKDSIGNYSVAMGHNTVAKGSASIAIGNGTTALGGNSTAMGSGTTASGLYSTAMGSGTIASQESSTAMGSGTIASGNRSTAMGFGSQASGSSSTAMGNGTTASGSSSTAMGNSTTASGGSSIAMGTGTTASGGSSTAMGYYTTAPSGYETVIGHWNSDYTPANPSGITITDRLFVIGNGTSSSDKNNALTILKNGNVGIGTESPSQLIHLQNTSGSAKMRVQSTDVSEIEFYNNTSYVGAVGINVAAGHLYLYQGGSVSVKGGKLGVNTIDPTQTLDVNGNARIRSIGSGAYHGPVNRMLDGTLTTATSDVRLKESIQTIEGGLDKVMQLRGVTFKWKSNPEYGVKMGFIAQEMEQVLPELVFTNEMDGYKGVNYAEMTAVLVEAVKEQQSEIDELKKIVQQQQAQISALMELTAHKSDSR